RSSDLGQCGYIVDQVVIPLDANSDNPDLGYRVYTTKIAPIDLQAGEPFFFEISIINDDTYRSLNIDLEMNQGYSPIPINLFYANYFTSSAIYNSNLSNNVIRSLSMNYHYLLNKSSAAEVNESSEAFLELNYLYD